MRNIGGEKPGANSMPSQTETTTDTTGTTQPAQARMRSGQRGEIVVHPDGRRTRNGLELGREREEDSESSAHEILPASEIEIVNRSRPEVAQTKTSRAEKTKADRAANKYASLEKAINAGDVAAVKQFIAQHPEALGKADEKGRFPLHQAVIKGQLAISEMLIAAGASINDQDKSGFTPLMMAAYKNYRDIAKMLLNNGANIDLIGPNKSTALMLATQNGNRSMASLLIKENANIDLVNKDNFTALMIAAKNGHTEIAKLLIDKGANIDLVDDDNCTAMMLAAKKGHTEIAKLLIDNGAKIDLLDDDDCTAMMLAAKKGHTEIAKLLIESEAKIDLLDDDDCTALMLAARNGHTEIAKLLIDKGAKINLVGDGNSNALRYSPKNNYVEIGELLIKKAESIDLAGPYNWTALMFAAFYGHTEIAKLLIDKEANINLIGNVNFTALMFAARNNHQEIAKLLIDNGAKIDLTGNINFTALMFAIRNNHEEIAKLLIDMGANIDLADSNNTTALMYAAFYGHTEIAKLLIDKGAKLDLVDDDNCTALMFAAHNNLKEIVELLLAKLKSFDPDFFQRTGNNMPADPSEPPKDYSLRQSLMLAVDEGHHEIVRLLLKAGAQQVPTNDQDEWPLHVAIHNRHPLVIKALVELGANLAQEDKNKKSALQLALDISPPNSVLIDIMLDAAATAAQARGKAKDVIAFDDLTVAALAMLQVQQAGMAEESAWRVFANSLCAVYGLRHIVAQALTSTLRDLSAVYLPTVPNEPAPTDAQWKRVFLQSVLSAPTLHDLSRQDDPALNTLYANSVLDPDFTKQLIDAAGAQATLLIDFARAQSDRQLQSLRLFIRNIAPGSTAAQLATFVTNEAGWHPLLAELLAESWQNLAVINRTAAGLYAAVEAALDAPAFAEKIENLASDAERQLVMFELTMLRELMRN